MNNTAKLVDGAMFIMIKRNMDISEETQILKHLEDIVEVK